MKYTQYMRDAAVLCGLPVSTWAYRALHSAAFEVHTVCHQALETAGLRNANEIAERKHAQWQAEQVRAVNKRIEADNNALPTSPHAGYALPANNPASHDEQWRERLDALDHKIATHPNNPMRKATPKLSSKRPINGDVAAAPKCRQCGCAITEDMSSRYRCDDCISEDC